MFLVLLTDNQCLYPASELPQTCGKTPFSVIFSKATNMPISPWKMLFQHGIFKRQLSCAASAYTAACLPACLPTLRLR